MTANVDILGEKREKVLTVPVEALFRREDKEVVYVKKAVVKAADSGGLLPFAFAAPKDAPAAKLEEKDRWKESFEVREVETGLASLDKVQVLTGLKPGEEVAVEDPSRPREKKDRE